MADTLADDRITVSIEETKRITSLGNTTVFALIKRGDLKVIRLGRRTLVFMSSIRELLGRES